MTVYQCVFYFLYWFTTTTTTTLPGKYWLCKTFSRASTRNVFLIFDPKGISGKNSSQRTMCISLGSSTWDSLVNHKLLSNSCCRRLYRNMHCSTGLNSVQLTLIKSYWCVPVIQNGVCWLTVTGWFPHPLLNLSVAKTRSTWLSHGLRNVGYVAHSYRLQECMT